MYQPAHGKFEVEDPAALLAELCARVPATLVTHGADGFRASILPMLFDRDDGPHGMLRGHLARGNPHWREIEASIEAGGDGAGEALAIFDGPDAYVSPALYEEKRLTGKVVPTWNYVTVQAHGTITTIHDVDWLIPHVGRLVARHEAGRPDSLGAHRRAGGLRPHPGPRDRRPRATHRPGRGQREAQPEPQCPGHRGHDRRSERWDPARASGRRGDAPRALGKVGG